MGRVTTRVRRTRFDASAGAAVARPDDVVVEEPLEIRVDGAALTTTMRTPGDDFDLTIGHLLTEGLLRAADEVTTLMHCTDVDDTGSPTYNVVDVSLSPGVVLHRPVRSRTEPMSSACGVCGSASIDQVRTSSRYAVGEDPLSIPVAVVAGLPDVLASHQPVFGRTGGAHAAALTTASGDVLAVREDVGRHNAVDKVIGAAAREHRLPLTGTVLVVSARASFEIVQKASVVGIPAVVAVGAPTSLAVDLARECGLTLVAFTRHPVFSAYSREDRLAP